MCNERIIRLNRKDCQYKWALLFVHIDFFFIILRNNFPKLGIYFDDIMRNLLIHFSFVNKKMICYSVTLLADKPDSIIS